METMLNVVTSDHKFCQKLQLSLNIFPRSGDFVKNFVPGRGFLTKFLEAPGSAQGGGYRSRSYLHKLGPKFNGNNSGNACGIAKANKINAREQTGHPGLEYKNIEAIKTGHLNGQRDFLSLLDSVHTENI